MEVPLENDEFRMMSEKQEHRVHTGGFHASENAESVSGLLVESEMNLPFDQTQDGFTKDSMRTTQGNMFMNNLSKQKKQ